MARGPLTFRQRDVIAVVKAVKKTGYDVQRVEVSKDGTIAVVISTESDATEQKGSKANEWDVVPP